MVDITTAGSNSKKYIMWAVYALVIVLVAIVILKIIQAAKAGAAVAGDLAGQAIVAAQTGISASRQIVCKNVAEKCAEATSIFLHTVMWVSNEEIYSALNQLVTTEEGKLASQYYAQQTGFSLKSILNKSLFFDHNRINADVYSGID